MRRKVREYGEAYKAVRQEGKLIEKGTRDCSVVAASVITGLPYATVHAAFKAAGRKTGVGTPRSVSQRALAALGFEVREWTSQEKRNMLFSYPRKGHRAITTYHPQLYPDQWRGWSGIFVTRRHMLAVKDGVVQDWSVNRSLPLVDIWEVRRKV
jgi:hypothetical protein